MLQLKRLPWYNSFMGIEIEIKLRLADPAAMREQLSVVGASPLGAVLENNTYFDAPDARLRRSDCGLRIRTMRPVGGTVKSKTGPSHAAPLRAVLTYKGPRRDGELKVRTEEEMTIGSPDTAQAILAALDYYPTLSFQKRRESFRLGEARIELDELPALGFFLEIEADDEETVQTARKALGLDDEPTITKNYIEMVAEHLADKSPKKDRLRF